MAWIRRNIRWIMIASGVLTTTMLQAVIAPEAALRSTFGESLSGPLAEIVVRNWGVLIALIGGMLIYGAFNPPVQSSRLDRRQHQQGGVHRPRAHARTTLSWTGGPGSGRGFADDPVVRLVLGRDTPALGQLAPVRGEGIRVAGGAARTFVAISPHASGAV